MHPDPDYFEDPDQSDYDYQQECQQAEDEQKEREKQLDKDGECYDIDPSEYDQDEIPDF